MRREYEYLVDKHLQEIKVSPTLSSKEKCRSIVKQGKQIFDFGLGQSPFPIPQRMVNALKINASKKDYLPVAGLQLLREEIAKYNKAKNDLLAAQAENIIVGPGSKALIFLLQLVYNGTILLPIPCWVTYYPQAKILQNKTNLIQTLKEDNWKLTPSLLKQSVKKSKRFSQLLILNYPNNPTGATYDKEELQALAQVAKEKGIIILSDEIYGELHHENEHVSIARFYPEGTIISNGISKSYGAGGWRLGSFLFPDTLKPLREAMVKIISESYSSVNAPTQFAAVEAYKMKQTTEYYLSHCRRILKLIAQRLIAFLEDIDLVCGKPKGGFYIFVDFSKYKKQLVQNKIITSQQLCDKLLEEASVAVLPASDFGMSKNELIIRLSYVNFNGENALKQSCLITLDKPLPSDFIDLWCKNVLEGVNNIKEWVEKL
jgi:aspartate aminotransferase